MHDAGLIAQHKEYVRFHLKDPHNRRAIKTTMATLKRRMARRRVRARFRLLVRSTPLDAWFVG